MPKIKLACDVPVEAKHGLHAGREFDVIEAKEKGLGRGIGYPDWWVLGDQGELVGVFEHEAVMIGGQDA